MTRSSGSGAARVFAAWFALVALAIVAALYGCNSTTGPAAPSYLCTTGCTIPENALADFQTGFNALDSANVARLFAPGFVFRFLQSDVSSGVPDSLERSEFLGCIGNLFHRGSPLHDPAASKISLQVALVNFDADNRVGHAGWKRYTVNTSLLITFLDGSQVAMNSPATLYFKPANGSGGAWQIAEWQDQPGSTSPSIHMDGVRRTQVSRAPTWGQLLYRYRPQLLQPYFPTSTPEGVITDFQNTFINLDVAEFDSLLASDFVFRFQQIDIQQGAPDSLDRASALNCLSNLMRSGCSTSPPAQKISLSIAIVSQSEDTRIGHAGWRRYVVNTALTITFGDGYQTQVNSPATFYFRKQPAGSTHWALAEWQDQPGSTSRPVRLADPGQVARLRSSTWGVLFRIYDCAGIAITASR